MVGSTRLLFVDDATGRQSCARVHCQRPMSDFAFETGLLEALSAHDDLVRRCASGDIEFREFVRLHDDFWWRYALDGHESARTEQLLLERHANRIWVHQKIAEEVLSALASASDATKQSYQRAGRIGSQDALVRLQRIASEFLDR
jgi:hypothetical protein